MKTKMGLQNLKRKINFCQMFAIAVIVFASLNCFAVTDILFLVDTTGSMSGIGTVETIFNDIITAIETDSCPESIMWGLADYRNRVDGGDYATYGVHLDRPFTNSVEDMRNAIEALGTGSGGDEPESQLKAMVSIANNWLTTSGNLRFHGRAEAQKIIIWLGDQYGHDELDDSYYPAVNTVINSLTSERIKVFALNRGNYHDGLDKQYHGHYQASEITAATGGELFNNVSSATADIKDAIVDAITCYAFTKDDGLEGQCANPENTITYSIYFNNTSDQTIQNAFIIDWLPDEVSYDFLLSLEPLVIDENYNSQEHYYRWELGDIPVNQGTSVSLEVTVETPAPGSELHNVAELYGTIMVVADPNDPNVLTPETRLLSIAVKDTRVCCWQDAPEILYVDKNAVQGASSGLDWPNAFRDLQDALDYAKSQVCGEVQSIYVAQGTYFPGDNENDSFDLTELPGIALYGGFPTGGCDSSLRNPKRYVTTLTGYIDQTHRNTTVVTMGNDTLLSGFTITQGDFTGYGVYGSAVDFILDNCTVEDNKRYGVYAENGNVEIKWCHIKQNDSDGIYHQGVGFQLTVSNSWIRQSGLNGIACQDSTPFVANSVITESDLSLNGRAGIMLFNPASTPRLHNLTIAHNKTMGVGLMGSRLPEIRNSIVYHNGDEALVGFSADDAAHYSCIEDCNSVNNNINVDPELSYFDPNNVRIALGSPCHDSGLTVQEHYSQFDMDNRARVLGVAVDRGAYEIDCEDTSNTWDWNADGLVNYSEFNGFSKAWMGHDPNDPAWLANPAIRDPNLSEGWYEWKYKYNAATGGESAYSIDLADVLYFAEESPWLWRACWVNPEDVQMQQMTLSDGEELMMFAQSEPLTEMPAIEERSVQEQMLDLASTIVFLERIWLEEPDLQQQISAEDWQVFMDAVHQNMLDLQTGAAPTE